MRQMNVIPRHLIFIGFYKLTGCQRDPRDRRVTFLVLYVDDILLAANDTDLLVETKQLLFSHFDMKDLREASYVLGIRIFRDMPSVIMRLSQ